MSWWTSQESKEILHPKIKSKFLVVFGSNFFLPNVKSLNKPKVTFDTKEYRLINHKFNYPGNATWNTITIKFIDMNGQILLKNGKMDPNTFDTSQFLWQIMNNTGYAYPYHNNNSFVNKHYSKDGHSHSLSYKVSSFSSITTPEKSSTIANSFGTGLHGARDTTKASSIKQKITIYQIDGGSVQLESPNSPNPIELFEGLQTKYRKPVITECWHLINPIVKSINWGDLAYDSDDLVEYELEVVYDWAVLDRSEVGKEPSITATTFREFSKNLFPNDVIEAAEQRSKGQQKIVQEPPKETDTTKKTETETKGKDSDTTPPGGKAPPIEEALDQVKSEEKQTETNIEDNPGKTNLATIGFENDSAELSDADKEAISEALKNVEDDQEIVLAGFASTVGPQDYNEELAQRRAEAVEAYIRDKGFEGDVVIEAVGEDYLAGDTAADQRVVEIYSADSVENYDATTNKPQQQDIDADIRAQEAAAPAAAQKADTGTSSNPPVKADSTNTDTGTNNSTTIVNNSNSGDGGTGGGGYEQPFSVVPTEGEQEKEYLFYNPDNYSEPPDPETQNLEQSDVGEDADDLGTSNLEESDTSELDDASPSNLEQSDVGEDADDSSPLNLGESDVGEDADDLGTSNLEESDTSEPADVSTLNSGESNTIINQNNSDN